MQLLSVSSTFYKHTSTVQFWLWQFIYLPSPTPIMEIAGIYSKRASRGCCKQQQQQENIVHCGRYCCGETISSYTTLEIPEKRLPLCGQWNNLHNYKAILEISIVICAAFLIISLLDQYKSVCHVYKNGSKLRFFVSSVTDLSKTY